MYLFVWKLLTIFKLVSSFLLRKRLCTTTTITSNYSTSKNVVRWWFKNSLNFFCTEMRIGPLYSISHLISFKRDGWVFASLCNLQRWLEQLFWRGTLWGCTTLWHYYYLSSQLKDFLIFQFQNSPCFFQFFGQVEFTPSVDVLKKSYSFGFISINFEEEENGFHKKRGRKSKIRDKKSFNFS